jgi:type I restriction enzyme, S subunit
MKVAKKEWKPLRLDELGFLGRGKSRHRPRNEASLYGGPYPFIQTADVMAADPYITSYSQTYSEFGFKQSKMWPPETLCMTIAGANTAKTAILKFEACFPDSMVGFIPDKSKSDIVFVKYALDLMRDRFLSVSRGATQDNLGLDKILSFPIFAPDVGEQRRLGAILSAYDELMENSQRRIRILEAMARALYREWFVHFRFPGHETHPRVASPLGDVPKGWETGRLDDVLVLQRGFDLPKADRVDGAVPIYAATGVTGFHNEAKVKAPGVVTGRSGTIGDVIYVQEDFWPLNTALWVKEFPKSEPLYAYYVLSSLELKQFNSGAAVPTLNRNDIHGLDALIPPRSLQRKFQEVVASAGRATCCCRVCCRGRWNSKRRPHECQGRLFGAKVQN